VTHGYGSSPTNITIQPQDNLGGRNWYIPDADINTSTFTLRISGMDADENHVFRWFIADPANVVVGVATIVPGTESVTVLHGFGSVPTSVWLRPKDDLGGRDSWVDYTSITATELTVYIRNMDLEENHSFQFICKNMSLLGEGNATVPADTTSIVVNHGFASTPSSVWVQIKNQLYGLNAYVDYSSITATQFTLSLSGMGTDALDFRFICYGVAPPVPFGYTVTLGGISLNIEDKGFHEIKQLIISEWKGWSTTVSRVVNKLRIRGAYRTWTLDCYESEVDWASSILPTLQAMAQTNTAYTLIIALDILHQVTCSVKVRSADVVYPSGTNVMSRYRRFEVISEEAPTV
jgi:hypothetical protein